MAYFMAGVAKGHDAGRITSLHREGRCTNKKEGQHGQKEQFHAIIPHLCGK